MDEAVALRFTFFAFDNFARENVSKLRKGVVKLFVVDGFVQVFDENVTEAGFSNGWISLAPHDSHWSSFQVVKVHRVESSFGIVRLLEVDVSVA